MNEQKRKILNIILIIINVILVVAIARVGILLYYEVEPNDYQTIICKYNNSSSKRDYWYFIDSYIGYKNIINKYNTISNEAKEKLGNNDEYVAGSI
jgi:hypothetical protein